MPIPQFPMNQQAQYEDVLRHHELPYHRSEVWKHVCSDKHKGIPAHRREVQRGCSFLQIVRFLIRQVSAVEHSEDWTDRFWKCGLARLFRAKLRQEYGGHQNYPETEDSRFQPDGSMDRHLRWLSVLHRPLQVLRHRVMLALSQFYPIDTGKVYGLVAVDFLSKISAQDLFAP